MHLAKRQLDVNVTEAALMGALRSDDVDAWSFLVPICCTVLFRRCFLAKSMCEGFAII